MKSSSGPIALGVLTATTLAALVLLSQTPGASSSAASISVDVTRKGADIASTMFGVFFEDINFAADGGLYPEQVKNRSFEFTEPLNGWRRFERGGAEGELIIRNASGLNESNPHYLRIRVYTAGQGYGAINNGFRRMGVIGNAEYEFSAYVRAGASSPKTLKAELVDDRGQILGRASLSGFGPQWKRHQVALRPSVTTSQAQLRVFLEEPGELDIDMVSLFPKATWGDRANGLRKDLVQLLADMKPGFIRFPGGCIVEGRRLELRYDWKKTVGDVSSRKLIVNRWNDEFAHRLTPDYFQSFGLGFYEYFLLSEDVGASPLPIVNCGMACQFNSGETAPLDQLDPFIQDALDLIEFANGGTNTKWGQLRAQMGHPAPFHLKMIGIGNEQWGPRYIDRYKRFAAVLKKAHPEITLISSSGPGASGKDFDYLWTNLREQKAEIIDEHYYMAPKWFLANAHRYDKYSRTGPKVFAGEYAAQTSGVARPDNKNNWEAALAEAAFITGLERNADVVRMTSYAPLLGHVEGWQWTPNLIWFDNVRSYGTPNYYVQKLYATNRGSHVLPVTLNNSGAGVADQLYTSAVLDEPRGEVIVKVVNAAGSGRAVNLSLAGIKGVKGPAVVTVLASSDLKTENGLDQPARLAPASRQVQFTGMNTQLSVEPYSFTVVRVPFVR
jgi:alpha-N-arabinofuranosidase